MRGLVRRFLLADHLKQAFSVHLTVPAHLDRASGPVPQGRSTAIPLALPVRLDLIGLLPFLLPEDAHSEKSQPLQFCRYVPEQPPLPTYTDQQFNLTNLFALHLTYNGCLDRSDGGSRASSAF